MWIKSGIFATEAKQDVLDEAKIKYAVDEELCFLFKSMADKKKAIKIFKDCLEW